MKLKKLVGDYFKINSPIAPFTIEANGEIEVKLEYNPTRPFRRSRKSMKMEIMIWIQF